MSFLGRAAKDRFRLGPQALPSLLPGLGPLLFEPARAMPAPDMVELLGVALAWVEPMGQPAIKLDLQDVDVMGLDLGHHAASLSGTSSKLGALPAQASQPFQAVPATTTSRSECTLMP